jgi:hypothetical protein
MTTSTVRSAIAARLAMHHTTDGGLNRIDAVGGTAGRRVGGASWRALATGTGER